MKSRGPQIGQVLNQESPARNSTNEVVTTDRRYCRGASTLVKNSSVALMHHDPSDLACTKNRPNIVVVWFRLVFCCQLFGAKEFLLHRPDRFASRANSTRWFVAFALYFQMEMV